MASDLYYGSPGETGIANDMGTLTLARHGVRGTAHGPTAAPSGPGMRGYRSQAVFADGHADGTPLPGLWAWAWHRRWGMPAPLPTP